MEGIKKAMHERNLNEGQWEDRKRWSLGVGQRRKKFWNRLTYIHVCHTYLNTQIYRGADKSLARPNSRCILLDGEDILFDAVLGIMCNNRNSSQYMRVWSTHKLVRNCLLTFGPEYFVLYLLSNNIVCFWHNNLQWARAYSFTIFLDHTQRRTTVCRTPLDEWSAHNRDLNLTTHNTHNRQTSMPPVEIEPTISAGEWPQTYSLDLAATGTGIYEYTNKIYKTIISPFVLYGYETWSVILRKEHRLGNLLYNGYWVFPGGKVRPQRDADPSPPSSAEVKNRVELYLYSPQWPLWPMTAWNLPTFQKRVQRRKFGPKRDQVTDDCRNSHSEKPHDLYCSPNIVRLIEWRRSRWAGHVARIVDSSGACRVLVGQHESNRPFLRPRHRRTNNIKKHFLEKGVDWIGPV